MVRVYTRSGDKGTTALFDGTRVPKDDLRVEAYGTVDELNSVLSLGRIHCSDSAVREQIRAIQRFLFVVGADLATPPGEDGAAGIQRVQRVDDADVQHLEGLIDTAWARVGDLDAFVVPGETEAAAHLHVARTVCRRAERLVVHLTDGAVVNEAVVRYLNRLSDLLFTWGRVADAGHDADRIGPKREDG